MSIYTFKSTEINNDKASEFETKSLLYLMGMQPDSEQVEVVAVDCFNDVTGMDESFTKLWDVQSKNHSKLPPSKIGESLYTLYDNYVSSIDFHSYILFIPKLDRNYLIDGDLATYGYENIGDKQKVNLEKKLIDKIQKPGHEEPPALFYDFLDRVTFVEDSSDLTEYVKSLVGFKNEGEDYEDLYGKIFHEIRNIQSSLKNSYIENRSISSVREVLDFNRHITKKEISTLIVNRLLGVDIFEAKGVPIPFLPNIKGLDAEDVKDLIQECQSNLSRAFFDKAGCRNFWNLSERVITVFREDREVSVQDVYDQVSDAVKVSYLNRDSVLYMISLVKEGFDR